MGLVKGFGLWLSRSALISFLVISILLSGVVQLTNEDYVSSSLENVIGEQLSGASAQSDDMYEQLVVVCNAGEDVISVPIPEININLQFTCDEVREGKEIVIESMKKQLTGQFLDLGNNQVTCNGFECLTKVLGPTTLQEKISIVMSLNFNKFMRTLSTAFLILAILGGIGLVLLSPGISGRIIALGTPLTIIGLIYFAKVFFESFLTNLLPSQAFFLVKDLTSALADKFLIVFIVGIVLLVVGFVIKYGFKINGKKK